MLAGNSFLCHAIVILKARSSEAPHNANSSVFSRKESASNLLQKIPSRIILPYNSVATFIPENLNLTYWLSVKNSFNFQN